ncbi:MAG TPA: hypothetical protein PKD85_02225 [Saprospiraceae bacterium]|nr:hypothetical protein [Saprospiraceae bacterium]
MILPLKTKIHEWMKNYPNENDNEYVFYIDGSISYVEYTDVLIEIAVMVKQKYNKNLTHTSANKNEDGFYFKVDHDGMRRTLMRIV